jgi:hypothetical protein
MAAIMPRLPSISHSDWMKPAVNLAWTSPVLIPFLSSTHLFHLHFFSKPAAIVGYNPGGEIVILCSLL